MKYTHDDIKDMMPDYLNGLITGPERNGFEAHIQECFDCGKELSLIKELMKFEAPDPGEHYWEFLPARARRLAAREKKSIFRLKPFFRPVPAFLTAMILAAAVISSVLINSGTDLEMDPFFEEPLAYSILDINGILEEDIPVIIGELTDESFMDDDIIDDHVSYSYHMEIAYLNGDEFESLFKALNDKEKKEG